MARKIYLCWIKLKGYLNNLLLLFILLGIWSFPNFVNDTDMHHELIIGTKSRLWAEIPSILNHHYFLVEICKRGLDLKFPLTTWSCPLCTDRPMLLLRHITRYQLYPALTSSALQSCNISNFTLLCCATSLSQLSSHNNQP